MRLMTANSYFDNLLAGLPQQYANFSSPASGWLTQLRANAVERVGTLTVPTTRDEDWRFTDLSPLTQLPWHPAQDAPQLARTQLDPLALPEAAARLVFVDGRYAPEHSFNHAGLTVEDLAAGTARYGAVSEAHLGRHAGFEHDAFTALNTAFLHGGALIVASPEMVKAGPVHLLYVATQNVTTSYPRCLVSAQR